MHAFISSYSMTFSLNVYKEYVSPSCIFNAFKFYFQLMSYNIPELQYKIKLFIIYIYARAIITKFFFFFNLGILYSRPTELFFFLIFFLFFSFYFYLFLILFFFFFFFISLIILTFSPLFIFFPLFLLFSFSFTLLISLI